MSSNKLNLLWIGDAGVSSGFARSTHEILNVARNYFGVTALGLNYRGDPHDFPYPIYPCSRYPNEDWFGVSRIVEMVSRAKPDVIVIQNDPWHFEAYLDRLKKAEIDVPVVGIVAVDGKNVDCSVLNPLALAIFWTQFGEEQARLGGYTGPSAVIPLGVDLKTYYPVDRAYNRSSTGLGEALVGEGLTEDAYLVGVVGRNQHRKRLDLTIEYFAEWVHSHNIEDVALWLHVAPTGEQAFDLESLAKYYGVKAIIPEIGMVHGLKERLMTTTYNAFDVLLSTTQAEGFWLPGFEAMACGVPVVAPDHSALSELLEDAAFKVWCSASAASPNSGVVCGIPDKDLTVHALDLLYRDQMIRQQCRQRGLDLVKQPRYRWENIGLAVCEALQAVLGGIESAPELGLLGEGIPPGAPNSGPRLAWGPEPASWPVTPCPAGPARLGAPPVLDSVHSGVR